MDLSALTEAQQQQLQQLHQQFQQHQLQQQQQQQQQQQEQLAQQQQDLSSQLYDQSQAQAYDQASQAYYPYHQYQQQAHQQHYAHYYPDYTNAYQTQPQQQQDSAAIHPPGVSIPSESSQIFAAASAVQVQGQVQGQGQAQAQHQQNAYYPQGVGDQQQLPQQQPQQQQPQQAQQPNSSYPVPPGLNPAAAAAVAALSQLTQFAGTMDAAERAMAGLQERQWHPKNGGYGPMPMPMPMTGPMPHGQFPMRPEVGRSPYRGGGRRGGRPFRGGGRGNFGQRHSRPDGSGPSFHGRERMGRGGGRRYPPHAAASASHPAATSDQEAAASVEGEGAPSADAQGEASLDHGQPVSVSASGQTAPTRRPQIAWCELCRVDCTSLEILEQHKNGKRHKKNLQRFEELRNARKDIPMIQTEQKSVSATRHEQKPEPALPSEAKPVAEVQNEQKPAQEIENELVPVLESKSEVTTQLENVQGTDGNKSTAGNIPTEVPTTGNEMDTEQPNNSEEQPEITKVEQTEAPARRPRMDRFDSRRRGMKRKMRGGWGSKRMRMSEPPRRPVEPPKPKEVVPLICDLCNVKCDTQAVFDCHLAGKKHISKLKRFQGHQAIYGPSGLQALYPPNPSAQATFFIPQGHPQGYYGPRGSFPHSTGYGFPQAHQAAPAAGQVQQAAPAAGQVQQAAPAAGQVQQVAPAAGQVQQVAPAASEAQQAATAAGGSELQVQQWEPQRSQVELEPGMPNAALMEPDGKKETYAVEAAGQQVAAVESNSENSISVSKGKEVSLAMDNSVALPSVNTFMEADKVLPATDYSGPVPEYGVTSSERVLLPGLDIKMDDHGPKNEEPIA